MLKLRVIEGHNRFRVATVTAVGIRYRGRTYCPEGVRQLGAVAQESGGAALGAVAGGAVFGAAGAIAGAALGGRGRIGAIISTSDGIDLVVTIPAAEYAELFVEVENIKRNLQAPVASPSAVASGAPSLFWRCVLGPLYFLRLGLGWYFLAMVLTIATYGLGWFGMPALAGYVYRRRQPARP